MLNDHIEFTVNQIQNEKKSFRKMTQFPQQERTIKKKKKIAAD